MKYHLQFDLNFTTNTFPGKYYAFEGIDGSGKTTQAKMLAEYFEKQGRKVLLTKEPTDGPTGELIRQVLEKKITLPSLSLQYLFCADRAVHLQETVIPALKTGDIVITDRSLWSSVVYGISDLLLPENEKERLLVTYNLLSLYGGFLIPDQTFFLKIPVSASMKRIETRGKEKSLYEQQEKLERIEHEYQWLAEKFKEYFTQIDADHTKTPEEVREEIVASIMILV